MGGGERGVHTEVPGTRVPTLPSCWHLFSKNPELLSIHYRPVNNYIYKPHALLPPSMCSELQPSFMNQPTKPRTQQAQPHSQPPCIRGESRKSNAKALGLWGME